MMYQPCFYSPHALESLVCRVLEDQLFALGLNLGEMYHA